MKVYVFYVKIFLALLGPLSCEVNSSLVLETWSLSAVWGDRVCLPVACISFLVRLLEGHIKRC